MVWYSHLLKNVPQFLVSHTVKGFGIVNKADVDFFFFLELSCFFDDPVDVGNLINMPTVPFFGIGMKTDFSSPVATAEFSRFAGILSVAL